MFSTASATDVPLSKAHNLQNQVQTRSNSNLLKQWLMQNLSRYIRNNTGQITDHTILIFDVGKMQTIK